MSDLARPLFGSMIGVVFGVVFFVANAGPFGTPGSIIVRVIGIVIGLALLIRIVQARRRITVTPDALGFGRGYWFVVLGEVVLLFAGVLVINRVLDHPEASVAWVAVVVGVHFIVLARVWRESLFTVLGVVMTVLGLAGIVLAVTTGSAVAVAAVAGIGSGLALFAAASRPLFAR
jgi:hypothetical protein